VKEGIARAPTEVRDEAYRNIFDAIHDGLIISDLESGRVVEANPVACKMHGYTREEFIEKPLRTYLHSDSQKIFSDMREFESDGILETRILHVRRNGSTFYAEWCVTLFNYQGQACILGIVRDITKRMQEEQSLKQRTHEQSTLLEISHTLASTLELQPELILDQLGEIIEYNHAGLFSLENSTLVTLAIRGIPSLEQSNPIRIDMDAPDTLKTLFNGHRPIRIGDVWSNKPEAQFLRSLLNNEAVVLLEGMQSWMWVPLAVKKRIIGGVGVAHEKRNHFTAHQADLALSVANQAAITMINAELYKQAQELAVLEERQRLARNLHDAVNQSLFSAGLIAEVLPRLWEKDQEEARRSLTDLRKLTRAATAELRALLAELLPSTLTDAELSDLLLLLGNAFTGRSNIPVALKAQGQGLLPAEVQVAIYRLCQEALMNISKHAKAKQVEIILNYTPTELELKIKDDGIGFDTAQILSGHYGLSMMRERAEAVNAQLSIISQMGQGTELSLHWKKVEVKEAV
jgi:PAS domain S-box-containing protein